MQIVTGQTGLTDHLFTCNFARELTRKLILTIRTSPDRGIYRQFILFPTLFNLRNGTNEILNVSISQAGNESVSMLDDCSTLNM
ncbi:hypothetical protein BLNAU_14160 [Blattamonas nauphoetae]|uniref:Uncharacterized protein n=1 Tax=Blattamonas nauphoetae TaxID=2049346 RepID=A0ABQ9XEG2_9EUKA|nr:hypothetical protein BLNAU_14160 [Blattamonas nauphoetae]